MADTTATTAAACRPPIRGPTTRATRRINPACASTRRRLPERLKLEGRARVPALSYRQASSSAELPDGPRRYRANMSPAVPPESTGRSDILCADRVNANSALQAKYGAMFTGGRFHELG